MVFGRGKKPKRILRAVEEEVSKPKGPAGSRKVLKLLKPPELKERPSGAKQPPKPERMEVQKPIEEPAEVAEKAAPEPRVPELVEAPRPEALEPAEGPQAEEAIGEIVAGPEEHEKAPAERSIAEALAIDSALEELKRRFEAKPELKPPSAPEPVKRPAVRRAIARPAIRLRAARVKKPTPRKKKPPVKKPRAKKRVRVVKKPTVPAEGKVRPAKGPTAVRVARSAAPKPIEGPRLEGVTRPVAPKPEPRPRAKLVKPSKKLAKGAVVPTPAAMAIEVEKLPLQAIASDSALEELKRKLEARREVEALKEFEEYTTFEPPKGYRELERYWVVKPYAWAAILFNEEKSERLYYLVEPPLTPLEKTILEMLHEHLLDRLTYEIGKDRDAVIREKALELLDEYGLSLDEKSMNKIIYYLRRNYVGYGRIDALLKDPRIEDISCDGVDVPIFLYHRDHQNIRTNIVFEDAQELDLFVIRLVERAGRQISLGRPTVDAALPEGYRLQATVGTEITTRGSSFSIRKYTEEPFTPVDLILHGTFSPEMLAYLWLATENKKNIMIVGGTASGKCVAGDTEVLLANSRLEKIRDLAEKAFSSGRATKTHDGWLVIDADLTVYSMGPDLKIVPVKVSKVWKRRAPDFLYRVRTRRGKEIVTTPEHPFFMMEGCVTKRRADEIKIGAKIATAEIVLDGSRAYPASPEIFWDEVVYVERVRPEEPWVYDLTVDSTHNFIANGVVAHNTCTLNALSLFIPPDAKIISIEDTRELTLYQDNWLASVTRDAHGERAIDMYDLLKQALRQRPEVIIVGEVRGKEALTLFQAMSTGHSCYSTMHAGSIQEMVHRLEGEPINVPHHMLTALDIVCLQLLTYHRDKRVRRNQTIVEVLGVDPVSGALRTNRIYERNPITDEFEMVGNSQVLLEIAHERGWSAVELERELENRKKVLEYLARKNMRRIGEVSAIIRQYYFDPAKVMELVEGEGNKAPGA